MTDHTSDADAESAARFLRELITQVDAGREPSAQDLATALDLDATFARDFINGLNDEGYLGGDRYTMQGRPVNVTWVADKLRAEIVD